MISLAIPTHGGMKDRENLLIRCLESLWSQTYQNFEIVITDNSDDDVIENICNYYKTGISYYRNPIKGMAQNTNESIRRSKGQIIKMLYMDDYLAHPKSLEKIMRNFRGEWLVTRCDHTKDGIHKFNVHRARYTKDIHLGNNNIGSPSVLSIKNEHPLLFDENLGFLLDCDYYRRMYDLYGNPVRLSDVNVTIGIHDEQVSNTMFDEDKLKEYRYMVNKYE